MAEDRERQSSVQQLEHEFAAVLVKEEGWSPSLALHVVRPLVRYLVDHYGGDRLYVPAPRRQYPVEDILRAWEDTGNVAAVCARFGVSRAKLYRLKKAAKTDTTRM